jgi:hypothetical protein
MYEVQCKNGTCTKAIALPYLNLLERLPYAEATNPDAGSVNLACPYCGHVFYYSPSDRSARYFVEGSPQPVETLLRIGILECDCSEDKCNAPTEILLPVSLDAKREHVLDSSDAWTIRDAYCRNGKSEGHRFSCLPQKSARSVHFAVS